MCENKLTLDIGRFSKKMNVLIEKILDWNQAEKEGKRNPLKRERVQKRNQKRLEFINHFKGKTAHILLILKLF